MKLERRIGAFLATVLTVTLPACLASPARAASSAAPETRAGSPVGIEPPARRSAGGGSGELFLDRRAVTAWLSAALPSQIDVELPAIGSTILRFGRPGPVRFVDGGLELALPLSPVAATGTPRLEVRLRPSIEPLDGRLFLAIERATWRRPGLAAIDVAAFLPPIELPRLAGAGLIGARGTGSIRTAIQRIVVEDERLRLELGFLYREPAAPASR